MPVCPLFLAYSPYTFSVCRAPPPASPRVCPPASAPACPCAPGTHHTRQTLRLWWHETYCAPLAATSSRPSSSHGGLAACFVRVGSRHRDNATHPHRGLFVTRFTLAQYVHFCTLLYGIVFIQHHPRLPENTFTPWAPTHKSFVFLVPARAPASTPCPPWGHGAACALPCPHASCCLLWLHPCATYATHAASPGRDCLDCLANVGLERVA